MKLNKGKLRILPILLILALLLTAMPTTAFAASYFSAIVKSGGMKIYRDAGLKRYWGKLPQDTVVKVWKYANGVAKISYGSRVGFADVDDMNTVESVAKNAVTKCRTRVYRTASTRSASVVVKKGLAVNMLAVSGNVARVERAGIVGYMRKDHLVIEGQASSGGSSGQSDLDRFNQAFYEQQQSGGNKPTPAPAPVVTPPPANNNVPDNIEAAFSSGKYTNEELCYAFLVKVAGYSHAAACGVVANIKYESGFKPGSIGDSGKSLGICQWYSSRRQHMIDWCKKNSLDPESLLGQLYYLKYDLEQRYTAVGKYLKGVENTADGAYDAAYYFCYHYERPANKASKAETRGNYAKNTTFNKFKNL